MVLSVCTHSHTSLAERNAIYSTHVCAQVDLYHLRPDHPYKYISSSRYANILQFLTQGTTQLKLILKQLQVRSRVLHSVASLLPLV